MDLFSLKFESLRSMLIQKEVELFQELDLFFAHETCRIDSMFGQESKLTKDFQKAIFQVGEKIMHGTSTLKSNEQESLLGHFDESVLNPWSETVSQKIKEIEKLITHQFFQESQELMNKIDVPKFQDFHNSLTGLLEEKFHKGEEIILKKPVQLMTSFKLTQRDDILEICQKGERSLQSIPNNTQFRELQYEFKESALTNEDKILIGHMSATEEITSIKFLMHNQNISDEGLLFLIPLVFWKIQDLERMEVNFRSCPISDSSVVPLIQNYFCNISSLSHINLNLNHTKISSKSIQSLSKLLKKSLSEVKLYLYNTDVGDESICEIFTDNSMLNLKTLVLSLTYTGITDKTIYAFGKMIKNRNNLETIELFLGQTKITDRGITYLIQNLPPLKTFKLGLEYTKVTDNIISTFHSSQPINMKSLKMLEMFVSDTLISQIGKNELAEIKNNLLSSTKIS